MTGEYSLMAISNENMRKWFGFSSQKIRTFWNSRQIIIWNRS